MRKSIWLSVLLTISCGGGEKSAGAGNGAPQDSGSLELCDGVDNDGDGAVDVGAVDAPIWYADADGDGFGAGAGTAACDAPAGMVLSDSDCDDGDPAVNPAAAEDCDGVDDDCSGAAGDAAAAGWTSDTSRWEDVSTITLADSESSLSRFAKDPVTGTLWTALTGHTVLSVTAEDGTISLEPGGTTIGLLEIVPEGPVLRGAISLSDTALVHDLAVDTGGVAWIAWTDDTYRAHLTRWSSGGEVSTEILPVFATTLRLAATEDGLRVFASVGGASAGGRLMVFDDAGTELYTSYGEASRDVQEVFEVGDQWWAVGTEGETDPDAVVWAWSAAGLTELGRYAVTDFADSFQAGAVGEDGTVWLSWVSHVDTGLDLWMVVTTSADDPATFAIADVEDWGTASVVPGQIAAHPLAGAVATAFVSTEGAVAQIGTENAMITSYAGALTSPLGVGVDGEGVVWLATLGRSSVEIHRLSCLD